MEATQGKRAYSARPLFVTAYSLSFSEVPVQAFTKLLRYALAKKARVFIGKKVKPDPRRGVNITLHGF